MDFQYFFLFDEQNRMNRMEKLCSFSHCSAICHETTMWNIIDPMEFGVKKLPNEPI